MDFSNRGGRPVQVDNVPTQAPATHQTVSQSRGRGKRGMPFGRLAAALLLFSATVVLAGLLVLMVFGGNSSEKELIKNNQYQAVFLDDANGQVYFGKLSLVNNKFYRLTDIYYVRVQQVQPEEGSTQSQQSISLAKLGDELHGPEDVMYIAKDKVLFWENLKDNGKVVEAIKEHKKNPNAAQQNTTNTNNTNTTNNTDTTNDEEN